MTTTRSISVAVSSAACYITNAVLSYPPVRGDIQTLGLIIYHSLSLL